MSTTDARTDTTALDRAARAIEAQVSADLQQFDLVEVTVETNPGARYDLIVYAVFERTFQHRDESLASVLRAVIGTHWPAGRAWHRVGFH